MSVLGTEVNNGDEGVFRHKLIIARVFGRIKASLF